VTSFRFQNSRKKTAKIKNIYIKKKNKEKRQSVKIDNTYATVYQLNLPTHHITLCLPFAYGGLMVCG